MAQQVKMFAINVKDLNLIPEFGPWILIPVVEGKPTPSVCPLISVCTLQLPHKINKCKKIKTEYTIGVPR